MCVCAHMHIIHRLASSLEVESLVTKMFLSVLFLDSNVSEKERLRRQAQSQRDKLVLG